MCLTCFEQTDFAILMDFATSRKPFVVYLQWSMLYAFDRIISHGVPTGCFGVLKTHSETNHILSRTGRIQWCVNCNLQKYFDKHK